MEKKEKKEDLEEELKLKQGQLKEKEVRMNGGISPTMKRPVMAIDKELEHMGRILEMRKIELAKDAPMNPKYMFENDSRWRELKREFVADEVKQLEEQKEKVIEQKKQVLAEIPELKKRIDYLEKALGKKRQNPAK